MSKFWIEQAVLIASGVRLYLSLLTLVPFPCLEKEKNGPKLESYNSHAGHSICVSQK